MSDLVVALSFCGLARSYQHFPGSSFAFSANEIQADASLEFGGGGGRVTNSVSRVRRGEGRLWWMIQIILHTLGNLQRSNVGFLKPLWVYFFKCQQLIDFHGVCDQVIADELILLNPQLHTSLHPYTGSTPVNAFLQTEHVIHHAASWFYPVLRRPGPFPEFPMLTDSTTQYPSKLASKFET